MIAHLKGTLEFADDKTAVIDVGGVGYVVHASPATLGRLPPRGQHVKVFTYMQVSENSQSLFGFLTREEVRLFTLLISVSGIGPKVATGILGSLSPSQVMMAIVADDAVALSKAPGVGKKTAQRLVLELRDKIKTEDASISAPLLGSGVVQTPGAKQDAMDALLALGYGRTEALQAVLEAADDDMAADAIIRLALRKLARQ